MAESHARSILKGLSWRIIATTTVVIIAWAVTGDPMVGLKIGAIEMVIKLLIYYLYERAWQGYLKDNKQTQKISLFKTLGWRVIASSTTFVIAYLFINNEGAGANTQAGMITAIELVSKTTLYYLHERAWANLPLGTIRGWFKRSK